MPNAEHYITSLAAVINLTKCVFKKSVKYAGRLEEADVCDKEFQTMGAALELTSSQVGWDSGVLQTIKAVLLDELLDVPSSMLLAMTWVVGYFVRQQ